MKKSLILLILLGIVAWHQVCLAKNLKSGDSPSDSKEKISVQQWESDQKIRNNLNNLTTVPLINKNDVQLDLGPAQFQITVPFN